MKNMTKERRISAIIRMIKKCEESIKEDLKCIEKCRDDLEKLLGEKHE